jgi:antagonist of KipI
MGGSTMGVMIHKPGLLTTVQDLGRLGYQRDGIIVSGPMDRLSMRLANLLVGNKDNDAVLEISFVGPSLEFLVDTIIAICGGNLSPSINNQLIPVNKPIFVKKGDILEFGAIQQGCRSYLAFKHGIQVENVLGSKSTCLPAGFGGLHGRPLKKGDILPVFQIPYKPFSKLNWNLSSYFDQFLFSNEPIRFIKGRQFDLFDDESITLFQKVSYVLTKDVNRMGYRLDGPKLSLIKAQEIVTEGVTFGSVQIPSSGQPIILMADHQTTGGYPKIAQIISSDLPRLAQLKPGDTITFSELSLSKAQQLAFKRENQIRALQKIVYEKWRESER